jgi:hypothetical protein
MEEMYFFALMISLLFVYFIIGALYSFFFDKKPPVFHSGTARSLTVIVLCALGVYLLTRVIADPWLSNRIQHAIGGGFFTTLVCFLAVRDTRSSIGRFQFFIMTALVVTSLGVLNELAEFFLHMQGRMIMSPDILDTWFDLASNTVGIVAALAILTPFVGKRSR